MNYSCVINKYYLLTIFDRNKVCCCCGDCKIAATVVPLVLTMDGSESNGCGSASSSLLKTCKEGVLLPLPVNNNHDVSSGRAERAHVQATLFLSVHDHWPQYPYLTKRRCVRGEKRANKAVAGTTLRVGSSIQPLLLTNFSSAIYGVLPTPFSIINNFNSKLVAYKQIMLRVFFYVLYFVPPGTSWLVL